MPQFDTLYLLALGDLPKNNILRGNLSLKIVKLLMLMVFIGCALRSAKALVPMLYMPLPEAAGPTFQMLLASRTAWNLCPDFFGTFSCELGAGNQSTLAARSDLTIQCSALGGTMEPIPLCFIPTCSSFTSINTINSMCFTNCQGLCTIP